MQTGIIILNVFAAIWAYTGLVAMPAPWWTYGGPAIVSLALMGWSWKKRDKHRARDAAESRRIGRLVSVWSAAEG